MLLDEEGEGVTQTTLQPSGGVGVAVAVALSTWEATHHSSFTLNNLVRVLCVRVSMSQHTPLPLLPERCLVATELLQLLGIRSPHSSHTLYNHGLQIRSRALLPPSCCSCWVHSHPHSSHPFLTTVPLHAAFKFRSRAWSPPSCCSCWASAASGLRRCCWAGC